MTRGLRGVPMRMVIGLGLAFVWFVLSQASWWAPVQTMAAPSEEYTSGTTPLYGQAQGQQVWGSLTPGTPVTPAGGGASLVQVTLDGWSLAGAGSVVYAMLGERIILATLTAGGTAGRKVVGESKDSYGNAWRHVEISGWVRKEALVPDVGVVWAAAEKLYDARCSACHALHEPTEFTANQWPPILHTMVKNAALDPEQAALVTKYLQMHAKPQ